MLTLQQEVRMTHIMAGFMATADQIIIIRADQD